MRHKGSGQKPDDGHFNHLIHEQSPYLLQHATNPVEWYPWCPAAFERASSENKPVFLSIGYSTCHWCHVMAHESFEDEAVAALLNTSFISIKVDREERPDIDAQYMTVCQIMTGHGGWPLTIIMTPDKRPFFAATYIPRESRSGRLGLLDLLPRIIEIWETQPDKVLQSTTQMLAVLESTQPERSTRDITAPVVDRAAQYFLTHFDGDFGGFGSAPKFPSPHQLLFLLRYWHKNGAEGALTSVLTTLEAMWHGGLFDHIGYGFHRYSTDRKWLVPHFEKMLYDQAMLSLAYAEAFQITGDSFHKRALEQTLTYVLRDMTAEQGGFYSAEDADSEGVEGKFYTWSLDELQAVLEPEEFALATTIFSLEPEGNFLEESTGERTGQNILHHSRPLGEISSAMKLEPKTLLDIKERIRQKLFAARVHRVPPLKDDKILTDWNGLMIAALARSAQILDNASYRDAASKACSFVLSEMSDSRGRLTHMFKRGNARAEGYLDDYAFMGWGLLELYEATFDAAYLKKAIELTQVMLELFWDNTQGGFFMTAHDAEMVLTRTRELYDGAIPSGNAVAFNNLARLSLITDDPAFRDKADQMRQVFSASIERAPQAYTHFLSAADFYAGPHQEIVVCGNLTSAETRHMLSIIRSQYLPDKVLLFVGPPTTSVGLSDLAPFTRSFSPAGERTLVYVCSDRTCQLPISDPQQLVDALGLTRRSGI